MEEKISGSKPLITSLFLWMFAREQERKIAHSQPSSIRQMKRQNNYS